MPMQAKAEGVKLFHAKAQLWALLGFVLMLLWFANSGTMYFMVAGDLLNPLDSIGFFKDVAMGSGRSGLQLVRSSQSLTVFSWLIPVNLCVAQFASERRARTDELFVSHGGRLSTLYRAKFGVVCGFYLLLQLAFYGICITITAIQMGIAPALGTVLLFCAVSVGNLLVLGAFLALASVLTLWMKNHAAAALVTSILPLAGVLLYQVQYEDFSTQPLLIQLAAKAMPTYYWSRLCALNITPQFCVELVAWVIVALAVAAGLGWMALHVRMPESSAVPERRTQSCGVGKNLPLDRECTGPALSPQLCMPFAALACRECWLCSACCAWRLLWELVNPALWTLLGQTAGG